MANLSLRGPRLTVLAVGLLVAAGLLIGEKRSGFAQTTKGTAPKVKTATGPTFAPGMVPAATDERVKKINELLEKSWKENKIEPTFVCSDYEFIRRASLDIIGRVAKPEEIDRFMKDPAPTRRAKLIEELLKSEEYSSSWAQIWTTWLMTRAGHEKYHEQMVIWLEDDVFGQKANLSYKDMVQKLLTASGKTNENGAVNYILSHLGEEFRNKQSEEGQFEMVPITARTSRLFLGYQIQCTQCHDHPFNPEWKQQHFWGMNAFFRQSGRVGTPPPLNQGNRMMPLPQLTLKDDSGYNTSGIVYYEKRNGVVLPIRSVFLDGQRIPKETQLSRREVLANLVVNHEQFPKAYVNRMWGHFFGRGMNENPPVDDFGEHNKVVHQELLDYLAKEFSGSGMYDPKNMIRWICSSKAYNLSVTANATNEKAEADVYFSRMLLKAMSPEQLFESLTAATAGKATKDEKNRRRQSWIQVLTKNFGDDEGNEVSFNGTVVQALLMMNGPDLNDAVNSPNGTPAKALDRHKGNTKAIMDDIYLAALNRKPTTKEYTTILEKLKMRRPDKDRYAPWQDLFWALLNSNEFILNH